MQGGICSQNSYLFLDPEQKLDKITTFPSDEIVSKRSIVYFDGGQHTQLRLVGNTAAAAAAAWKHRRKNNTDKWKLWNYTTHNRLVLKSVGTEGGGGTVG